MPVLPAASRTEVDQFEIDPRSFHVFEFEGDRLLFDRATGTTSELNDVAFETLRRIREGMTLGETLAEIGTQFPETDSAELVDALAAMKARGMFQFVNVHSATEEEFESLWQHRPRRIQMLMAEGCNLGCRYCYQWRNGTNQKHTLMPWSVARTTVDYLVWRSGPRKDLQITFFGGEPLLNYPMVRRVVEYCKLIESRSDKRFTFELITNGTLLDAGVVEFLVEHRFLLFISLDGWREMHNYNRPSLTDEEMYDTILKNALHANRQYEKHKLPKVKVRANLTRQFHDKQKVADFFESLGFKLIGIGPIEPLPHGDPSPAALTEDQMDQLHETSTQAMLDGLDRVKRGEKLGPYLARMFNKANKPLKKREWLGVTCGVCRNTTIVDNRGNLYPCHRYAEMKEYQIGNVFTGMDRQSVMNYYRKINSLACEECHDCWIRDYCAGGCAWLLSDKEGVLHHATPQECTRRRKSMERGLWLRKELRESFPQWFDEGAEVPLESWNWDCDEEEALFQHSQTSGTNAPNGQQPQLPLVPLSGQSCCSTEQSGKSSCGCGSSAGSDSEPHALVQLSANFNQTETINSAGGCTTCSDCGPECGSTTPHDQQATFYLEPIPGSSSHEEG